MSDTEGVIRARGGVTRIEATMKLPRIDTLAMFLLIIGGLNSGISAVFDYNVIGTFLGSGSDFATVLYACVGISAAYKLAERFGFVGDDA